MCLTIQYLFCVASKASFSMMAHCLVSLSALLQIKERNEQCAHIHMMGPTYACSTYGTFS